MTWLRRPGLLLALLVATIPVHALNVQVGFALKPWFLPLLAVPVLFWRRLRTAAARAPRLFQAGVAVSLASGVVGALAGRHAVAGARHLVALGLVYVVALAWLALPVRAEAVALALRVSGLAMAVATIAQSAAFLSSRGLGFLLRGVPGLVEPTGYLAYDAVRTVRGLHIDSNMSALHAVVWILLLVAFPSRRLSRNADSVLAGLLVAQVVLTFSRSGVLALAAAGLVHLGARALLPSAVRRPGRLALAVVALTAVVAVGAVAAVDLTDGRSHLRRAMDHRVYLIMTEGNELLAALLGTFLDPPDPRELEDEIAAEFAAGGTTLSRNQLWERHLTGVFSQPLTGVGYGAGPPRYGGYAHNGLLEAASGGGLLGLAGYVLLWAGAAAAWWRRRRSDPTGPAVLAAAAAFLAGSLFLTTNYEPLGGLLLALLYTRSTEKPPSAEGFSVERVAGSAQPLVTVVTPCLNPGPALADCLRAVAAQSYPRVEHVVVDGGSDDGTVELLRGADGVRWVSERDSGQSEAINKGIGMARGELVTWLNHDDTLEPDAVARVVSAYLDDDQAGWVYGDCRIVEDGGEVVWRAPARLDLDDLLAQNRVPQQGTFVAAWALAEVGGVDESLHLAMDYDLWVRLAAAGIPSAYVPAVLGTFTIHATSKTGAVPRAGFLQEEARALRKIGRAEEAAAAEGRAAAWDALRDGRVDLGAVRGEGVVRAAALVEAAAIERNPRHLLHWAVWRHRVTRRRVLTAARNRLRVR